MGVKAYLEAGKASAACEEKLRQIVDTKEHCAKLLRRIVTLLYTEMLITDAHGDVLRLLGELFELLDEMGDNYEDLIIAHPGGTHLNVREDLEELNSIALKCVRAIAVGVYTYSRRVMMTVGDSLLTLTPLGALVVVVSHSLVLFIFSSTALEGFLASHGLPTIPLLPVSGSQAVIGSVVGIGLLQGIRGIRPIKWKVLVGIASGWITTPLLAAVMGFVLLFVVQNIFGQQVYQAAVTRG